MGLRDNPSRPLDGKQATAVVTAQHIIAARRQPATAFPSRVECSRRRNLRGEFNGLTTPNWPDNTTGDVNMAATNLHRIRRHCRLDRRAEWNAQKAHPRPKRSPRARNNDARWSRIDQLRRDQHQGTVHNSDHNSAGHCGCRGRKYMHFGPKPP